MGGNRALLGVVFWAEKYPRVGADFILTLTLVPGLPATGGDSENSGGDAGTAFERTHTVRKRGRAIWERSV